MARTLTEDFSPRGGTQMDSDDNEDDVLSASQVLRPPPGVLKYGGCEHMDRDHFSGEQMNNDENPDPLEVERNGTSAQRRRLRQRKARQSAQAAMASSSSSTHPHQDLSKLQCEHREFLQDYIKSAQRKHSESKFWATCDSGCTRSVMDMRQAARLIVQLQRLKLPVRITRAARTFKFGNGNAQPSVLLMSVPFGINGIDVMVKVSLVASDTPLLLSESFLESVDALTRHKTGQVKLQEIGVIVQCQRGAHKRSWKMPLHQHGSRAICKDKLAVFSHNKAQEVLIDCFAEPITDLAQEAVHKDGCGVRRDDRQDSLHSDQDQEQCHQGRALRIGQPVEDPSVGGQSDGHDKSTVAHGNQEVQRTVDGRDQGRETSSSADSDKMGLRLDQVWQEIPGPVLRKSTARDLAHRVRVRASRIHSRAGSVHALPEASWHQFLRKHARHDIGEEERIAHKDYRSNYTEIRKVRFAPSTLFIICLHEHEHFCLTPGGDQQQLLGAGSPRERHLPVFVPVHRTLPRQIAGCDSDIRTGAGPRQGLTAKTGLRESHAQPEPGQAAGSDSTLDDGNSHSGGCDDAGANVEPGTDPNDSNTSRLYKTLMHHITKRATISPVSTLRWNHVRRRVIRNRKTGEVLFDDEINEDDDQVKHR